MSGGHFGYENDSVCNQIFNYRLGPNYGEDGFSQSAYARRLNPLEDMIISELVYDVFCILHSYDWYVCGDICKETYRQDVEFFKKKWIKPMDAERVKEVVESELSSVRKTLYAAFGVEVTE